MHFDLVDRVLELSPGRIVTLKTVSAAEEYLQDHFPSYPVLPGVLMLEAMVQAARRLIAEQVQRDGPPLVLGKVRALKYGRFVKPGSSLRVEIIQGKSGEAEEYDFKGEGLMIEPNATGEAPVAVSGRFLLRPARVNRTEFVSTNLKLE